MEDETHTKIVDILYPVLHIPKACTSLETNCVDCDNVFIKLHITSPDTEGNNAFIYSGFCKIMLVDTNDSPDRGVPSHSPSNNEHVPVLETVATYPSYSQSQVWIDPTRSPYVYNSCNTGGSEERYSVFHQSQSSHITVEQHNTYITQNVYNCKDSICYSPVDDLEHKMFRKVQNESNNQSNIADFMMYDDDEFECGVFLSKLPEEIWNENENRAREQMKYVGMESENNALKQLMSSGIQSLSKQQKTILFLGHDSHYGQTIQKIAINDPYLECAPHVQDQNVSHEVVIGPTTASMPNQKKYQCDKCKQIFDQIAEFKQHMIGNHKSPKISTISGISEVKFMCLECGKNLKNQEKFEMHCFGHGNPDLECNKCHKVFASKFTLRTHKKIHQRKHPCKYCSKTFASIEDLQTHATKIHFAFMCHQCPFTADTYDTLREHRAVHEKVDRDSSEIDFNVSIGDYFIDDSGTLALLPEIPETIDVESDRQDEIAKADSIIAKVVYNEMFLQHSKNSKHTKKLRNVCDVCLKSFDRVSDLKRHLIEHIVRSTLAKNPVNKEGTLNIVCEICQVQTFTKVDKYKAHLREHAKLTLYKCTFCDKSFSDSSNFSKHKKIHGVTYFQCDLCHRKFNSKKMIVQHMEYHNNNTPIECYYCNKVFHFESMLNKHIKYAHTREIFSRFRCRFCHKYFKSLKDKWDHEWNEHNVRKTIIDCMICGHKFRKYSELKRHCTNVHEIDIPPAKNLFKKRKHS